MRPRTAAVWTAAGRLRRGVPPALSVALVLALVLAGAGPASAIGCLEEGIGTTYPRRTLNLPPGSDVNVTCVIDLNHPDVIGYNASDLYFTRSDVRDVVPASQYTVLNSSAVLMTDRLESPIRRTYECRLRHDSLPTKGVCMTEVNIGYPPLKVDNFRCTADNWRFINCTWNERFNPVTTKYQVDYHIKFYEKPCVPEGRPQPPPPPGGSRRRSCVVPYGVFRMTHTDFQMVINASNELGSNVQKFDMETFAIIVPAPPVRVWSDVATADSIHLLVEIGEPMYAFPRPLEFAVDYTSRWDNDSQPVNLTSRLFRPAPERRVYDLTVRDLVPFTDYHLRVRMRSSLADEDRWSKPAVATVRTRPAAPSSAPRTDVGSFQLIGAAHSRTVYVYWHQIAARHQNGPNFTYCVTAEAPGGRSLPELQPDQVTAAYARFRGVGLERVTVRVAACNAEGRSEGEAELTVPARPEVVARPRAVTLVVFGSDRFELTWEQSPGPPVDNYTLFWCEHTRDRPFQCQGQLNWTHVPGSVRSHNLTLPADSEYQFAVSANRLLASGVKTSSGMVWSGCTLLASSEQVYLSEIRVESRGRHHLTLSWNGDCSCRATAANYVVYFCQLYEDRDRCLGNEVRQELSGRNGSSVRVVDLEPYTRYRLYVAVVSAQVEGQRSWPVVGWTRQDRPDTPPVITQVIATSNTSLQVTWSRPTRPNGPLDHYQLWVDDRKISVSAETKSHLVTGLLPYTKYSVRLSACNRAWRELGCSALSPAVSKFTLPGVPGPMEQPQTQLLNVSAVRVRWQRPRQPGGPRPRYILLIVSERDGKNVTNEAELPAGRWKVDLRVPECEPGSSSQRHLFAVRATVELANGQPVAGPWSELTQQNCVLISDWPTATIVAVVVGGAFLMMVVVLVFFFVCSRTKRKLTEMRNLGVNLPPGLDRLEKPPLHSFPGPERRPAVASSGGYGRLVSQNNAAVERTTASVSGQPLLQDELTRDECDGEGGELTPAVNTDSNSCSSSATHYTDSGAECEKASSPTYNKFQWPTEQPKLSPYVQVGGPETASAAAAVPSSAPAAPACQAPPYTQFSPYVDAKAIQSLMARSMETLPAEESSPDLSRSEPDLSAAGAGGKPLVYSRIGQRSSTGYVSMASDDALPGAGRPAARLGSPPPARAKPRPLSKPELKPYVALGPPPPPASAAGFPPYVLAGPPAPDGPTPVGSCSPAHGGAATAPLTWASPRVTEVHSAPAPRPTRQPEPPPARHVASAGYVAHDKLRPATIELRQLPASAVTSGYVSQEALAAAAEPVLSPKKLPTVATSRDPYCRVVTSHQGPPDLGPNVSMV